MYTSYVLQLATAILTSLAIYLSKYIKISHMTHVA